MGLTIKNIAALAGSLSVIWMVFSGIGVFIFVDPALAWSDERNDKRYVQLERFAKYETRAACQYAETQIDQLRRLTSRFTDNTVQEVREDYTRQIVKHEKRYVEWGCDDALEGMSTPGLPH